MAIRQIRIGDDPILRKKCREVTQIDERTLQILEDMLDTLHQTENGAAIAANQVGILKRLVVIDYCEQCLKLINPKIIDSSGEQECIEGCLSFPGRFVKTLRPERVTVEALDEHGEKIVLNGEGEMAKCFCHELEHLDGNIFLEHSIGEVEFE